MSNRPSTALTRSSSRSLSSNVSSTINDLTQARDLLERMVQERDERITTLQTTTVIHKEHISKLQEKLDSTYTREKQQNIRYKMQVDMIVHEKDMALAKNEVLERELKLAKEDPLKNGFSLLSGKESPKKSSFFSSLKQMASPSKSKSTPSNAAAVSPPGTPSSINSSTQPSISALSTPNKSQPPLQSNNDDETNKQILLLQSQLYHAMNSLSSLKLQTSVLKESYDDIVGSLQEELLQLRDKTAKNEVDLMSQLAVLEREKKVRERILEAKFQKKDEELKRLQKKLESSHISLTNSGDDDDNNLVKEKEDIRTPTEVKNKDAGTNNSTPKDDEKTASVDGSDNENSKTSKASSLSEGHKKVEDMLLELENLSNYKTSPKK